MGAALCADEIVAIVHEIAPPHRSQSGQSGQVSARILVQPTKHRAEYNVLMVTVDREQCEKVASLLRGTPIPEDREDTSLSGIHRSVLSDFLFLVVAICHQTTPASGEPALQGWIDGKLTRGWDYLLRRLADESMRDPRWTTPSAWPYLTGHDLRVALRDPEAGDRITDPEGRAELVRDLGNRLLARSWSSVSDIKTACEGRIGGHAPNLISELAGFRAYQDPVRKKTFYFLALMRNFGLWSYTDEANLGPPADYHEVRGHLRIGTVRVVDATLLGRLIGRKRVSVVEDNAIRSCVVEAIVRVAEGVGVTPSRAHYMFWNLFRNICTRENPQCFDLHADNPLPTRYRSLTVLAPSGRGCPFAKVCLHAGRTVMPQDPVVITEYH